MHEIPFAAIRAWMFQDALPFWAAHGVDHEHGGFLEDLTPQGAPTACGFKRVRVTCRQVYVFSHAAHLGWTPGADLSRRGFEYLIAKARVAEGHWARTLSRAGEIIDPTADLYEHAFALYAFAWRYRASRDEEALRQAHATLDFIQQRMRASDGGFAHALPAIGPRLQNPHMHLMEACLVAFEASNDQRFLDQANELLALFRQRLFDGRSLGERFAGDWRRLDDAHGLEPGHHFEWAWLLAQVRRFTGADVAREAQALVTFAETFGVDPATKAVFDAVRGDGAPLRRSSRAWTNTERIKAWLALYELTGRDPREGVSGSVKLLFDRYFAGCTHGTWVDQFDENGAPLSQAVPASIVYHLFLAFSEILRLEAKLTAL